MRKPEPETLLQGRTVTDRRLTSNMLRTRLVDPFAKPRQRVRRLALAHLGKRRIAAERRRNIVTPRNPVNEAPGLEVAACRRQLHQPAEPRHDVCARR